VTASANVGLVRSIYAAWERGDFFSSAQWAHPEIEFVIVGGLTAWSSKGLAGMAEGTRDALSAWADLRIQVDEYRELDSERVLVLSHVSSGHAEASGLEVGRLADLFHLNGGRVTKLVHYFNRDRALADLGLAPEGGSP
jgi:ketosteroid isomerase-like protein